MKLVRVDRLAPGGAALELHPRVTVLSGASPEMRRRLVQTVRSMVGEDEPECPGVLEVSGVRLALDRSTLDQLRLDRRIDPVLALRDPLPRATGTTGTTATTTGSGQGSGSAPSEPQPSVAPGAPSYGPAGDALPAEHLFTPRTGRANPFADVEVPDVDPFGGGRRADARQELRAELRRVTEERTRLAERMEQVKQGLDSFSRAALDVVRGQIEALESRRSTLRQQWEARLRDHRAQRERLLSELSVARASVDGAGHVDPSAVSAAREQLAIALDVPDRPDPAALELAERLEHAARSVAADAARAAEQEAREQEASRALLQARHELSGAESGADRATYDPSVVRRLEQIREELFASDDRAALLGPTRSKRRIQELRAEEAVLLDRLGFDTYSAYVMGIPSVRADLERSERLVAARERVAQAEAHLGAVRAGAVLDAERRHHAIELSSLLEQAAVMVGTGPLVTPPPGDLAPGAAERLVEQARGLVEQLRRRRTVPPGPDVPQVRDAVRALQAALQHVGALEPTPSVVTGRDAPRALLGVADTWLAGAREREAAAAGGLQRLQVLEAELAALDASAPPERDVTQWAEVEADLDAALDRLAEAEDRVRSHEEAMDRLADLRGEELAVRERERELLAALSEEAPAAPAAPSVDAPPSSSHLFAADPFGHADPFAPSTSPPPAPIVPPASPPPFHGASAPTAGPIPGSSPGGSPEAPSSGSVVADVDVHWTLVSRLAEQRAVSFAGSLPLVVDGLPTDARLRDRLLERIRAMSDLVQIVVLSDEPAVRDWVDRQGHDASLVQV